MATTIVGFVVEEGKTVGGVMVHLRKGNNTLSSQTLPFGLFQLMIPFFGSGTYTVDVDGYRTITPSTITVYPSYMSTLFPVIAVSK